MSDTSCPCQARPGTPLRSAHVAAARVGARLDRPTAIALTRYCQTHACGQSEALRRALTALAASAQSPEDQLLATLIELLGLPADATLGDVHAAIDSALAPPQGDAMQDTAEFKAEQLALAKITDPAARAKFIALRKQRRSDRLNGSAKNQKARK